MSAAAAAAARAATATADAAAKAAAAATRPSTTATAAVASGATAGEAAGLGERVPVYWSHSYMYGPRSPDRRGRGEIHAPTLFNATVMAKALVGTASRFYYCTGPPDDLESFTGLRRDPVAHPRYDDTFERAADGLYVVRRHNGRRAVGIQPFTHIVCVLPQHCSSPLTLRDGRPASVLFQEAPP